MIRNYQHRPTQLISGFKSPADDYLEGRLDIRDRLVIDPHCTFYFAMGSPLMQRYGIPQEAILIVDRSIQAETGAIVIANIDGELTCRAYVCQEGRIALCNDVEELTYRAGMQLEVWGVVTAVCYAVLPPSLKKGRYTHVCAL